MTDQSHISDSNCVQFETTLNNIIQWQSNPTEATRLCFKFLYSIIRAEQNKIELLSAQKASKSDLNAGLNIKANIADIMRTFSEVAQNMEQRPSLEEVNLMLEEKVGKKEIETMIKSRPTFDQIKLAFLNGELKPKKTYENLDEKYINFKQFTDTINELKVENEAFYKRTDKKIEDNIGNLSKKISEFDGDLDRFIDNVKKQFNSINVLLNKINGDKADKKEVEILKSILNTHSLSSPTESLLSQLSSSEQRFSAKIREISEKFDAFSQENALSIREIVDFNKKSAKNFDLFEAEMSKLREENTATKGNLETIFRNLEALHVNLEDMEGKFCELKGGLEELRGKMKGNLDDFSQLSAGFVSFEKFEQMFGEVNKGIQRKIDELENYTKTYLRNLDGEMEKNFGGKVGVEEMREWMGEKVDVGEFNSLKLNVNEIIVELNNRITHAKFIEASQEIKNDIFNIKKDLMIKANIDEIMNYLNNKADAELTNQALTNINNILETKASSSHLKSFIEDQSKINKGLLTDNKFIRLMWDNKELRDGCIIIWNKLMYNTSYQFYDWGNDEKIIPSKSDFSQTNSSIPPNPSNFYKTTSANININVIQEQVSVSQNPFQITIKCSGIYEISLVFFVKERPTVQLLVNEEEILSLVGGTEGVIRHENDVLGGKFAGPWTEKGGRSSVRMREFVRLEKEDRVSVSYSGSLEVVGMVEVRYVG